MFEPRPGRFILAFSLLVLVVPAPASSQPPTRRGDQELAVHVSPDFESAIGDMILADAGYGYFLRDRLSLRATLGYAVLEDVAGADSDYRMQEAGLAVELHLGGAARWVPYAGAGIGWRRSHFGDLVESGLVYGPQGGLKVFLADNVALDLQVVYRLSSDRVFINDFVPEDSDLSTGVGLRFKF